jgi:hypothetical protein
MLVDRTGRHRETNILSGRDRKVFTLSGMDAHKVSFK